jgi:hypothetical protein
MKTILYRIITVLTLGFFFSGCTAVTPDYSRRAPVYHLPKVAPAHTYRKKPKVVKPARKKKQKKKKVIVRNTRTTTGRTKTLPPAEVAETVPDPYDKVPDSATSKRRKSAANSSASPTSAAVKSLLKQARASSEKGRHQSATSKLERALRIEPRNPHIWHQLARTNYEQGNYRQAVTMAKKSNRYTSSGSSLNAQNWALIKKASKKSGDIKTLKQAISHERSNP